jgi:hypothetical protein
MGHYFSLDGLPNRAYIAPTFPPQALSKTVCSLAVFPHGVRAMRTGTLAVVLFSLLLCNCGGGGGGSTTSSNQQTTTTTPPPVQTAQGVYEGTTSTGLTFDTIVLPNDQVWAVYGTSSNNVLTIEGLVSGQGKSSGGSSYTANVTDYFFVGQTTALATITASFVPGTSISGQFSEAGQAAETISGAPPKQFNYNTAALLSDISGTWNGTTTISATGAITGTLQGCSYSGTIQPDSSGKNFFDVSITLPTCVGNQALPGIAVDYLLPDGITRQLIGAVASGNVAAVAVGTR